VSDGPATGYPPSADQRTGCAGSRRPHRRPRRPRRARLPPVRHLRGRQPDPATSHRPGTPPL